MESVCCICKRALVPSPTPHPAFPTVTRPSCLLREHGKWMRPRRGGATESTRPAAWDTISGEEGGGGGGEGGKKKKIPTGSVGLCFWLGGKPRNAATGGVRTLPFTSRVSRQYFCAAFPPLVLCALKAADWRALIGYFWWRKKATPTLQRCRCGAAVAVQWMKIVFGSVFRAEHSAEGTGGALDQSAPAMPQASPCRCVPNCIFSEKQHFYEPGWPRESVAG